MPCSSSVFDGLGSGRATGRGGFVLEWWEGPYADELHRELIAQLVDGGSRLLGPQDFTIRTDIDHRDVQHRLFLLIRGVPVEFRSCDAVGLDQTRATSSARRLQALQLINRAGTGPQSAAI